MALKLKGSTSGFVAIDAPSVAGNNTLILPENNGSAQQLLGNDITAGVVTFTSVTVNRNGDLTVPGTISIGGTLTYEDVTSVDSVGIVTARSGVRINGGGLTIIGDTTGLKATGISTFVDVSARNLTVSAASTFTGNIKQTASGSSTAKLTLNNESDTTGMDVGYSESSGLGFINVGQSGSGFSIKTGGTASGNERIRIDSSGNYGLGTGTPTTPDGSNADNSNNGKVFTIYGDSPAINLIHNTSGGSAASDDYSAINFGRNGSSSNPYRAVIGYKQDGDALHINAQGSIKFDVGGNIATGEAMRITSGRVLMGTTTEGYASADNLTVADSANCGLTLRSGTGSLGTIAFSDATSGSGEYQGYIQYSQDLNYMDFSVDAGSKIALKINAESNVTAVGVVTATQFAATTISNSRKNLLINGAMTVNQRVGSPNLSYFNPVTSSIYTLDRWKVMNGSSFDTDSAHIHQSTQSPDGFSNSMKWEIGNTETPSANQNCGIEQKIEGQDLQHLAYGTSSAKTMTLSFYVRSNKLGTYNVHIMQEDGTKYQMHEYTIDSSNTWEKKTIRIVGNTANAINNDSTTGLRIIWVLTVGSSDHVAATSTWASGGDLAGTSNQVNLWDNGSNEWYLTGCQLEVGEIATAYEVRTFAEELASCQRYYYQNSSYGTQVKTNSGETINTAGFGGITMYSATSGRSPFIYHPVMMRAIPTTTFYSASNASGGAANLLSIYSGSTNWDNVASNTTNASTFHVGFKITTNDSFTAGDTLLMGGQFSCEAEL